MLISSTTLLRTDVPIALSATAAERVVLYSVPLTAVTDDEVFVHGRFQVSSPVDYPVMVGSYICRADSPTSTTGTTVARAIAENVIPDMHHLPRERVDFDKPPAGDCFYNLVLYAASVNSQPGQTLRVDAYGKVNVQVNR